MPHGTAGAIEKWVHATSAKEFEPTTRLSCSSSEDVPTFVVLDNRSTHSKGTQFVSSQEGDTCGTINRVAARKRREIL